MNEPKINKEEFYHFWKSYWNDISSRQHPCENSEWFDRYAKEILFYLEDARSIVDAGCGNGEIIVRIHSKFESIMAIDYSESMIAATAAKLHDQHITNVALIHDNILNIDKIVEKPVDCIYNNGVVQYLSEDELSNFIKKSKYALKDQGRLVLMNIPDEQYRDLYLIGFYHSWERKNFLRLLAEHIRARIYRFRKSFFHPRFAISGDIGMWYSKEIIAELGKKNGFRSFFTYSIYPPYGYRFHAILSKDKTE